MLHTEDYTPINLAKSLGKIGLGFLVYLTCARRLVIRFPRAPEKLEHLMGGMSLVLVLLFWMVIA